MSFTGLKYASPSKLSLDNSIKFSDCKWKPKLCVDLLMRLKLCMRIKKAPLHYFARTIERCV